MRKVTLVFLVLVCLGAGTEAAAQEQQPARSEDLEPRTIGTTGTNMVGFAGYLDRFYSSERLLPTTYTAQVDLGRFLTPRIVVKGGLAGSGSYGGDEDDERPTGLGVPSLHAYGGLSFYLTPQSMWSWYAGAEYWTQLNQRAESDRGSILGMFGLQGAISSRTSLFLEGGYGLGLTGGDERTNRLVGRVGLRVKF